MLAQLAQAHTQCRVLASPITGLKIGDAFDYPDRWIVRDRVVGKLQKTCQRHGRAMDIGRRDLVILILQLIALPDQDDTWMRTEHGLQLRQTGLCIRSLVAILARSPACAIGGTKRPQNERQPERKRAGRNNQRDVLASHPRPLVESQAP
jgi:hypothetical protein